MFTLECNFDMYDKYNHDLSYVIFIYIIYISIISCSIYYYHITVHTDIYLHMFSRICEHSHLHTHTYVQSVPKEIKHEVVTEMLSGINTQEFATLTQKRLITSVPDFDFDVRV